MPVSVLSNIFQEKRKAEVVNSESRSKLEDYKVPDVSSCMAYYNILQHHMRSIHVKDCVCVGDGICAGKS